MYGDKATKLIQHITRNDDEIIPEYQYQLVADILRENDELYAENLRTSQTFSGVQEDDFVDPAVGINEEQDRNGFGQNPAERTQEPDATRLSTSTAEIRPESPRPSTSTAGLTGEPPTPSTSTAGQHSEEPTPSTSKPDSGEPPTNGVSSQNVDDNRPDGIDNGEKELMVMQARHTAKLWNKRCLIAYHYERLNRLKRLRWDYGNNLPREIVEKLSKGEHKWFATYNDNLFSYMRDLNYGKGLDLTLYATPPKKLFIQVKCVRDYGQFDLEDGQPVMLKKDSIHFLPLSQCEKLIHQGVLEQMSL